MNRSTANARRLFQLRRGAVRGSPSPPYIWIGIAVIVCLALFQWYQERQENQQAAEKEKQVAAAKGEKPSNKKESGGKNAPAEENDPPAKANKKPVELEPSVTARGSSAKVSTAKDSAPKGTSKETPSASAGNKTPAEPDPSNNPNAGKYRVIRVADGDTLTLEGKHRVRLIGINCPEIDHPDDDPPTKAQPWSAEATKFTEARVKNQVVRIEFDPKYETEDDYGRWLCWVYYRDRDGVEKLLNEELLRQGLAFAYDDRRKFHYTEAMYRRLKTAQREAQDEERGIYSK